jgi:hypothetical protein
MKPDSILRVDFLKTDHATLEELWAKRDQMDSEGDDGIPYANIEHLIAMKLTALRGNFAKRQYKDLPDILHLAKIHDWSFEQQMKPLLNTFGSPELAKLVEDRWGEV